MELNDFKKKLNLKYTFGMKRTNGASRRYHDSEMNIGAETHTPRDEKTQQWGEGKTTYYFENDEMEFDSIEGLFEAYTEKIKQGVSDISKCKNNDCESKDKCYRYAVKADTYWQSYILITGKMKKCDNFIKAKHESHNKR